MTDATVTVRVPYSSLAAEVAALIETKQAAYGNSFGVAGDFLRLLWPNGVPVESYADMLCIVRMFDKFKRIATDPTALGEDPYADLVGYSLLNLARVRASR